MSLVMVENVDIAALLLEMHALGGDYMRDAKHNIQLLANGGGEFFIMALPDMLVINPARLLYQKDTSEYELWTSDGGLPDGTRTFILSVTDKTDGRLNGNLFEVDLTAVRDHIRDNGFFFTHLDAEMKDGTSRRVTLEEWNSMDRYDRDQLKSWRKVYDPADEVRLSASLVGICKACEKYLIPVTAGEFIADMNAGYMAGANNPQPDMLRVTLEAAREILSRNDAPAFRLTRSGAEKLSPIDAAKTGLWYMADREFAIKSDDLAGIEKWAARTSAEMLRQAGRGEHKKSRDNTEL